MIGTRKPSTRAMNTSSSQDAARRAEAVKKAADWLDSNRMKYGLNIPSMLAAFADTALAEARRAEQRDTIWAALEFFSRQVDGLDYVEQAEWYDKIAALRQPDGAPGGA